jgi:hypothetical protein
MNVPKLILAAGLCLISTTLLFAQKKDFSKLSKHNLWSAGIGVGSVLVSGDVDSKIFSLQQTVEIKKQFASWFAVRFNYVRGNTKGQNWLSNENFAKNTAWSPRYAAPVRMTNGTIVYGYTNNGNFTSATSADKVYYNYKTTVNTLLVSAQFTLPIPFSEPKFGVSVILGTGALFYKTKVNTLNSDGTTYASFFNKLSTSTNTNKKQILAELKAGMDKSYETKAEDYTKQPHSLKQFGYGISYRPDSRLEVSAEHMIMLTKSDLIDGHRWQEHAYGEAVLSRDWDMIITNTLSLRYYFK